MEEEFLGVRGAAEFLGIKESTVYAWIHQKKLIPLYVGRLVRFTKEQLRQVFTTKAKRK